MGRKNDYLVRQKARNLALQEATRQTFVQFMTDMMTFALNDPEAMGKDVFGHVRLKRVIRACERYYSTYIVALTQNPEADYARAKMDEALKRIWGDEGDFVPFEKRYDWLPEISYEKKTGKDVH